MCSLPGIIIMLQKASTECTICYAFVRFTMFFLERILNVSFGIKLIRGFSEYMKSGGELAYQQLCSEITVEFNDCSKQVPSSTADHS